MTFKGRLVLEPKVSLIASNTMQAKNLHSWAEDQGLLATLENPSTPLGAIYKNLKQAEGFGVSIETPQDLLPEFAGRFCYRSFEKGRETPEYIGNILEQGHGSVMEHGVISLAISGVSRSLSHELVRHRAGFAISQESQRYVDAKDINFVVPPLMLRAWNGVDCSEAEDWYGDQIRQVDSYVTWQEYLTDFLMSEGMSKLAAKKRANEAARSSLPNSCETRLVWTGNLRALRHVVELRGGEGADLEIRRLAKSIFDVIEPIVPRHFFDVEFRMEPEDEVSLLGIPAANVGYTKV